MLHLLLTLSLFLSPQITAPIDPPVLEVNGEQVPRSEFDAWMFDRRGEFLVSTFLLHERAAKAAEREGVRVKPEEVRALLDEEIATRINGAFDGDAAAWERELTSIGRTVEGRRRDRAIDIEIERNLDALAEKLHPISDAELEAEWQRLHGPGGERHEARLLYRRYVQQSVPGETRDQRRKRRDAEVAKLEQEVEKIRRRALDGEDFVKLVAELSEDRTTRLADGRATGGLNLKGWSLEAKAAVEALAPGEISRPLFAKGGFWLVLSEGKRVTPFESVREQVRESLMNRGALGAKVNELKAQFAGGVTEAFTPAYFDGSSPEDVVLRVDGREVTRREFTDFAVAYRGEQFARRFAESFVIKRLANEHRFAFAGGEIERRVDEYISRTINIKHDGDRDAWLATVQMAGRSEASYRRELYFRELDHWRLERLMRFERAPTEAEIKGIWEREYGPKGRRIYARWIEVAMERVDIPDGISQEELQKIFAKLKAEAESRAQSLIERLDEGEDFGTLAREHSADPRTASKGGDPGRDFRFEDWIRDADELFGDIKTGSLVGPTEIGNSFWVFEFLDVTRTPFESVKETLLERALNERPTELVLLDFLRERIGDPEVKVLPAFGRKR